MRTKLNFNLRLQWRALYAHLSHEINRMFRIPLQIFLPSVVTTLLYFLIFGKVIGSRIGDIQDVTYSLFITPGLVMLAVITNSYANAASSLFSARFQHSIEELLVSPMHPAVLLLGYLLGSVMRGIFVGLLVMLVASFFVDLCWTRLPIILLLIAIFSLLFALAGFLNGMIARNFEDVFLVPTFILSPLTYLGGIFYSLDMLPPVWYKIAQFNPIVYMINVLRFVMINQSYPHVYLAMGVIIVLTLGLGILTFLLLKKGVGIRA